MTNEIVATSQNIENVTTMLKELENIKDDSSKLREISLDNTGWEGMDATAFNNSLNDVAKKLDGTSTEIEEALKAYKSKQEEQLEQTDSSAKVAAVLDEKAIKDAKNTLKQFTVPALGPLGKFVSDAYVDFAVDQVTKNPNLQLSEIIKNVTGSSKEAGENSDYQSGGSGRKFESPSNAPKSSGFESPSRNGLR